MKQKNNVPQIVVTDLSNRIHTINGLFMACIY